MEEDAPADEHRSAWVQPGVPQPEGPLPSRKVKLTGSSCFAEQSCFCSGTK